MSYSFAAKGASIALLAAAISTELDKVGEAQPIHVRDRPVADGAVADLLALCAEPAEGEELTASVAGSCWSKAEAEPFQGVSLSIHIGRGPAPG